MSRIYIIAGCNGAGKTTASYTILPEILDCDEFVNADEIARGLSPLNPDEVAIHAGRLMLERMHFLMEQRLDFALETTLSTKTHRHLIQKAKKYGYEVTLIFFTLSSPQLAVDRVAERVREGGHNIPTPVILRRYHRGLRNFFNTYLHLVDKWILLDNSETPFEVIASKRNGQEIVFKRKWLKLKQTYGRTR